MADSGQRVIRCGNPECFDTERTHLTVSGVKACHEFSYTMSETFRKVAERYALRMSDRTTDSASAGTA